MAEARAQVHDQGRWNARRKRWECWSGKQWAPALYSARPESLRQPTDPALGPRLSEEQRRSYMRKAVDQEVLAGATVVQQDGFTAVLQHRRPVDHALHLLLTVLTVGAWGLVWLIMAIARKDERVRLAIDVHGHVWATESQL